MVSSLQCWHDLRVIALVERNGLKYRLCRWFLWMNTTRAGLEPTISPPQYPNIHLTLKTCKILLLKRLTSPVLRSFLTRHPWESCFTINYPLMMMIRINITFYLSLLCKSLSAIPLSSSGGGNVMSIPSFPVRKWDTIKPRPWNKNFASEYRKHNTFATTNPV